MNYGLLEIAEDIKDYLLGQNKVPYIFYNEEGDWEKYLPKFEKQRTGNGQETSACTVFGTLSQIETFYKFLYNEEPNYSERFTYNLVPINPDKGTDPQRTHETIRKNGLVDEKLLPMTQDIEQYMDKSKLTGSLLAKGLNWLHLHDYMHEWVWTAGNRPDNWVEVLRETLMTSPVAVSVSAWNEVNGVYVSDQGSVNNHYCLLYKIDSEGHPWIFDSYDQSKKKLAKDHNIRRAKRIWINKKVPNYQKKHIGVLQAILNRLMNKKTLLDVCNENLGKDASPQDSAPDELGCVDSVTTLMRQVRPETPHMLSTVAFNTWLKANYTLVDIPQEEDIIISPTVGKKIGHVGIVMENGLIGSNNSFGINKGKFTKNYTYDSWVRYFKTKRGLQVLVYRKMV